MHFVHVLTHHPVCVMEGDGICMQLVQLPSKSACLLLPIPLHTSLLQLNRGDKPHSGCLSHSLNPYHAVIDLLICSNLCEGRGKNRKYWLNTGQ